MKYIAVFICLVGLAMAVGYTDSQQAMIDGTRLSFKLGQTYERIQLQGGDVTAYNSLVDQWNAWVATNFGQDQSLLMQKMRSAQADLSKPYVLGNNTTNNKGIVHAIDSNANFATNDINELPEWAISKWQAGEGKISGDGYLGGV